MEEKKPFGARVEDFFAGKGFYIVLLLCVGVIGVSVWSMLRGGTRSDTELAIAVSDMEEAPVLSDAAPVLATEAPAARPAPTESPEPAEAPAESTAPAAGPAEEAAAPEAPAAADERSFFIWPVSGELETAYAMTALIYDPTMRDWRTHDGVDISAAIGTQVRAAANGTVAAVYDDERWGTTVVITHSGGLESIYANLAATPTVKAGDPVGVGQVIGAVGDTALCEIGAPSHLHFAMTRNGESVDPGDYMP